MVKIIGMEEKPFNQAKLLMERLDKLMQGANESTLQSVHLWFKVLRSIKSSIVFALTEDENDKCEKKIKAIRGKILNWLNNKNMISLELEIEQELYVLEEILVVLMYNHGIYYPKYENKTWQEKAKEEDV